MLPRGRLITLGVTVITVFVLFSVTQMQYYAVQQGSSTLCPPTVTKFNSQTTYPAHTKAFNNYDPYGKPIYVKNLPKSVNPALFAEAEKRLINCEYLQNKTAGPLFLTPQRGEWIYDFKNEFYMIQELIQCHVPFTFTRQSDGEYHIMLGHGIQNTTQAYRLDHWTYGGGFGKLSTALQRSLDTLPENNGIIIQALVCPGVSDEVSRYQVNASQQTMRFISNTYLFLGCNYMLTSKLMDDIIIPGKLSQPVIVIANIECINRESIIKQWATEIYYLPDDIVNYWEVHAEMMISTYSSIARSYTGALFLISGGPAMPPLQLEMSKANPWNQYLSMGSSLEKWTKGANSRGAFDYDPECFKPRDQCVFRKHPVTGKERL